jgi:hypothetical protein
MRLRMIFSHFLPGIDGICDDETAIQPHPLSAFVAILRIDLEESSRVRNFEEFHDMNFGCFWRTGYGAED